MTLIVGMSCEFEVLVNGLISWVKCSSLKNNKFWWLWLPSWLKNTPGLVLGISA